MPWTKAEQQEYERVTREFLGGKPITFVVPADAINPWDPERSSTAKAPRLSKSDDLNLDPARLADAEASGLIEMPAGDLRAVTSRVV